MTLYYLIIYIILVLLQLTVITFNGFTLFIFSKLKSFRQNSSRLLMLFLTTTDILHAITTLPYTIYLICSWNPVYLDLNPYYIMISSIPLIIQLKVNLILTVSIAAERTLALSIPVVFRSLSSHSYAMFCLFLGFLLAILDLVLEFSLTPFKHAPNCASMGCFLSDSFLCYWGMSNMVMGFLVIILTALFLMKLRAMHQKPQPRGVSKWREDRFKQANRSSVGILLISLLFVTLPSVGVGLVEMVGFPLFKAIGPFYIFGLLCEGACSSVIYVGLNKEMHAIAKKCITGKGLPSTAVSTIKALSTVGR